MSILDKIGKQIIFFDGGMGSLLQEKGLKPGELPETWNIRHSDVITEIHRSYLEAGSDIITTNTFGANRLKYHEAAEYGLEAVVSAALKNAVKAVEEAEKTTGRRGVIALDLGPTGKLLKPLGDLDFEEAVSMYKEVVEIGVKNGADCILIETMSDGYEMKAAVLAVKENSALPVFATLTFDERGKLLTGGDVSSAVALLEGLGVDAVGINCGLGPVQMKKIAESMIKTASVPVIINPNAGLPRSENGKTVYDIDADEFAKTVKEIADMGASFIGGCCGTTPEHIRKTVELCKDMTPVPIIKKDKTVVTSWSHAVEIGRDPVIIGERINPTGKSKLKQALKDHNLDYLLQEGVVQQDNGAHILDVNVGLPDINEPEMMTEVVRELQSVLDLPLQIDTSDVEAMERAMRIYNGKPLVNSVNGKEESMRAVFPLVKKYGGVVVALALDEGGIPETPEGRLAIAEKIYRRAAEYGIEKKDILVDALCLTVSSDSKGALTTLETVQRITVDGGRTILGVSNISFGLPHREIINASFFAMALQSGLSAAIINPNSEGMMRAYYSFRALADLDAQCADYIAQYAGLPAGGDTKRTAEKAGAGDGKGAKGAEKGAVRSLGESVEKGLREQAVHHVRELLEEKEPLTIIQEEMIPALDAVGKRFEEGTMFLPQLLMSAEAAKAAFEVIKDRMAVSGQSQEKKGTIILATVKGDIHDIGKNIVKVLLENYSYDVIDLGKDVPPELILQKAQEEHVPLVGLSALMTTTVPSMEETIRRLRKEAPWVKVMVGGAVLTEEYARTIDADRYCRDAMASVKYAEEIFL
ncbi:homocysteine S-methyltransferase family protein [Clostridium sp. AM58-1XD]|uniref:homocysteine S-methyltransferase family protein n=1 Tax=Clostridium sp. AM58-1XD TaxID=2292307 RepID=UPI000E4EAD03|nr:homocysteine S-methyltransferase family protein [Clostridium sp. AM58-1XD]RGY96342.1 homocysteine methyltransferase [Clostridium sp. AM58-1XD]